MPDVNERLDTIENTLTGMSQQFNKVDEQFTEVRQRLDSMDQRLDSMDSRLDSMDSRLDSMDSRLDSMDRRLGSMDQRLDRMDGRQETMDQRLDTLAGEVQRVRVLEEEHSTQIRLIAEVQTHHGRLLGQIVRDLEPLKVLPDLFKQVVQDHERRIGALEKSSGSTP